MRLPYKIVDVFSAIPLAGNPVAVVFAAEGLSSARMQAIARWNNLSETTFVLPPSRGGADYLLKIFTPQGELPFAGHPTLGSAHAVLESGYCAPRESGLVQECGVGLIKVFTANPDDRSLSFSMPTATSRDLSTHEVAEFIALLNDTPLSDPKPSIIDVGAVWVIAQMENVESLLALTPDFARSAKFERSLGATGLCLYATYPDGSIETRTFAPSSGVNEDPVCGSGNGSIAIYRLAAGQITTGQAFNASQGIKTGRDGHMRLTIEEDGTVYVSGKCVTTVTGEIML